ncbi:MAG: hypothetical protein OXD46_12985 [Chloroflexi bacterium]|nr:hypothetical protein [Chloroflexota bacterium]
MHDVRDEFAAHAMQALIVADALGARQVDKDLPDANRRALADLAYKFADQMIAAKQRNPAQMTL